MKKILSLLLIITLSNLTIAQTTAIPDAYFEQVLVNLGLDATPLDGTVPTANIDTLTFLSVGFPLLLDLTGIQDFTALTTLLCSNSQLTSLDVSQNTALTNLQCSNNQLTSLDVSQNTALSLLDCSNNQLTSLDVSQNTALFLVDCSNNQLIDLNVPESTALNFLYCSSNQLTNLNVSKNTFLGILKCDTNQLTCLNVKNGNNNNFNNFSAYNNPNLTCVDVDDVAYSTTNWTNIDAQTSFSTNCGNGCSPVGIDEHNFSNLVIYPNPTQGQLTIDLGEVISKIKLTLTNSLGQLISFQEFESTDIINIDIDAPKGLYFLQIGANDRKTKTLKILKE